MVITTIIFDHFYFDKYSPCVTATQNYINSFKVFATEEKARGAKSLVASFNREALNAGNVKTHPTLSDVESATLFRLGIFQVEDAFHYIPDFQKKWNDWRDQLQTLLDACAQYATIREGYDAVVKDEAEY